MTSKDIPLPFGFNARVLTDAGLRGSKTYRVLVGRGSWIGAGYIGGFTAFLAVNCPRPVAKRGARSYYQLRRFQAGITRNANRVPYSIH